MKKGKFNFLIGGPAGVGVEKSGKTMTTSLVRGGYYVYANVEHMSQVRGGNNFLRLRVDEKAHSCHVEEIDIMIALDKQTVDEHIGEVVEGGAIIFDNEALKLPEDFDAGRVDMISVPLKKMATEYLGNPVMANVIALGITCGLIDFDILILKNVLAKIFAKKGAEVIQLNEKAAQMGFDLGKEKGADFFVKMPVKKGGRKNQQADFFADFSAHNMFLMGTDALCLGAVKGGCKFVGEYPMTPSSSVLHFMAKWAERYGIVVKHTEDEISACNSVIGAGFAGARAMSATSGGGFALMSEAIGLAGMNEVPIVVANVMRPGPATGLPTRSDQGDLRQVIHAGQGDPLKIVLLPGDVHECFQAGFDALNLAEKYQLPVIICYDKYLGESYFTVPPFDDSDLRIDRGKLLSQEELDKIEDYKRYLRTEDGISPRAIPGLKGGTHRATSDEHDEYGDIDEGAGNRNLMMEKRMKKLELALRDTLGPELTGGDDADLTFVTWGSCKGICLEALELLSRRGIKANLLQIKTALPFHTKEVKEILEACKRSILVEHNYTGQMGGLIAEHCGIIIEEKILRYDGRPMTAKFVADRVK